MWTDHENDCGVTVFHQALYAVCVLKHMYLCYQARDVEAFLMCTTIHPSADFFTPPWGPSKFDQFPSLAWSMCLITFTAKSVQPLNTGILKCNASWNQALARPFQTVFLAKGFWAQLGLAPSAPACALCLLGCILTTPSWQQLRQRLKTLRNQRHLPGYSVWIGVTGNWCFPVATESVQ